MLTKSGVGRSCRAEQDDTDGIVIAGDEVEGRSLHEAPHHKDIDDLTTELPEGSLALEVVHVCIYQIFQVHIYEVCILYTSLV